ncbi:MAG: type II secretion system F family protein [Lachnospiraceae bacterium]|nr:type II secretion system F family protein [Lachnospiraceae bacterium]
MKNKEKLTAGEMTVSILVYALLSVIAAWLFYDRILPAFVFAPFFLLFIKAVRTVKRRKYTERLTDEFLRALVSVSTSLAAGISCENAFLTAALDMEKLYGTGSAIVKELGMINMQVKMGVRLEEALHDFAKRSRIPEIYDFAVVFSVAKEKGADFSAVIASCISVMEMRRQSESEARVLIRAKQYEQRVMCIIPPGIIIYLKLSSGSFIGMLYHDPAGVVIMTLCLIVYVFAIWLSEKIGDVKV